MNKTISAYYAEDHDVLDRAMMDFKRLKGTGLEEAKPFFRRFKSGLKRHIFWEEKILFPVFEEKTGMKNSGPTAVMRQEHVMILEALEALHDKVRQGNIECDGQIHELVSLLKDHNYKEEGVLYPAIDSMIGATDLERIYQEMEKVTLERNESCGCSH